MAEVPVWSVSTKPWFSPPRIGSVCAGEDAEQDDIAGHDIGEDTAMAT